MADLLLGGGGVVLERYPPAVPIHRHENGAGAETPGGYLALPSPQAGSSPPVRIFIPSYKEK